MEQVAPEQSNARLVSVALALMVCVLATGIVVAYLWLRPPDYVAAEMVFVSGELDRDLDLYQADQFGRHRFRLTKSPGYELFPSWSPDGSKLLFLRTGAIEGPSSEEEWARTGIYIVDFEGAQPKEEPIASGRDVGVGVPSWSPDGLSIGVLSLDPSDGGDGAPNSVLALIDLESKAHASVPLSVTATVMERALSWSPDGTRVAFDAWATRAGGRGAGERRRWGYVYDLVQGRLTQLVPNTAAILWSPKAELLACRDQEQSGTVHLVRSDGTLMRSLEVGAQVTDLAWSPDGSVLALVREREGESSELVILSPEEGELAIYASGAGQPGAYLAWSPDGQYLGYTLLSSMHVDDELAASLHVVDVNARRSWTLSQTSRVDGMSVWRAASGGRSWTEVAPASE